MSRRYILTTESMDMGFNDSFTYEKCEGMAIRIAGNIALGRATDATWSAVEQIREHVASKAAQADQRVRDLGHAETGAYTDWRPLRRLLSHPIYTRPAARGVL